MTPDPATAPPRPDLTYLRHRSQPRRRAAVPPPAVPAATPAPVATPASAPRSSLDLDDAPAAGPTGPTGTTAPAVAAPRRQPLPPPPRVAPTGRVVLTDRSPTVTLTALQSGIGTLTIEAAVASGAGDVRLGAAYDLASGLLSTVQASSGRRAAPPGSRSPVLVAGADRYEQIAVDLRQVRRIRRVLVYVFSDSGAPLAWAGTIVVTTGAGARVEIPLDGMAAGSAAVVLSMYGVSGELVLRSEHQGNFTTVRDACRAFGYDTISWVDDRTPVD